MLLNHDWHTLKVSTDASTLFVQFNREKDTNAFSRQMTLELMAVCQHLSEHNAKLPYRALVLTGGIDRSFSAGGDFNDVSQLNTPAAVRAYLGEIIDLYQAILAVPIPVIAAIDHYAIGQGLQVALMCDWRIGSTRCQLQMPELKNGVACPLGATILEFLWGRGAMLHWVIGCDFIETHAPHPLGIINEHCEPAILLTTAATRAEALGNYPAAPYQTTKRIHNARFNAALEQVREDATEAHIAAFARRSGEAHFHRILKREPA